MKIKVFVGIKDLREFSDGTEKFMVARLVQNPPTNQFIRPLVEVDVDLKEFSVKEANSSELVVIRHRN